MKASDKKKKYCSTKTKMKTYQLSKCVDKKGEPGKAAKERAEKKAARDAAPAEDAAE